MSTTTLDRTTWKCRRGHVIRTPLPALAVTCGKCASDPSHRGSCAMRPQRAKAAA